MNTKIPVLAAALAVGCIPLAAGAQGAPPPPTQNGTYDRPSPSPEQRAQMEKMRADAKAAIFAALTPAHRTAVQAIVDDLSSGKTADPRDAAAKIDALLTPDESKAVLAAAAAQREKMRANRPPGAPDGPPPGGPPGGGPPGGERRAPDAGRVIIMTSISRERMRELRGAAMQRPPN